MMRSILTAALVLAASLSATSPAAAINCEQARKYAATGRSAEDISDTMVADPEEVKKCLAEGQPAGAGASKAAPAPTAVPAGGHESSH